MSRAKSLALRVWLAIAACAWAWLLPVWEGFDEAQHYAYAQHMIGGKSLPVLGRTHMTPEVWQSFSGNPVSLPVQRNYPSLTNFDQARNGTAIAPSAAPPPDNYEAHQAPLAYIVIGLADSLLRAFPLELRLRLIRVLLALLSAALIALAAKRLTQHSWNLRAGIQLACTTVMFYGACGHVANDWLALGIFVCLFAELRRRSRWVMPLLAAGLLVKSYFLVVVPWVLWAMGRSPAGGLWLLAALPWYARNVWLYGNLTGMQEQLGGLPWGKLADAAWRFPWLESAAETFRLGLWLGNNSFVQWSPRQGYVMALLLTLLFAIALRRDPDRGATLGFTASYFAGVCLAGLQSNVSTNGEALIASPWYATPLWVLVILYSCALLGPVWYLRVFIALWSLWYAASFWVKLVPWYAGVADGPSTIVRIQRWYTQDLDLLLRQFPPAQLILFALATAVAVAIAAALVIERRNGYHD